MVTNKAQRLVLSLVPLVGSACQPAVPGGLQALSYWCSGSCCKVPSLLLCPGLASIRAGVVSHRTQHSRHCLLARGVGSTCTAQGRRLSRCQQTSSTLLASSTCRGGRVGLSVQLPAVPSVPDVFPCLTVSLCLPPAPTATHGRTRWPLQGNLYTAAAAVSSPIVFVI